MFVLILRSARGDLPYLCVQVDFAALHASNLPYALANDEAELEDSLAIREGFKYCRKEIPKMPYLRLAQDAIASTWRARRFHAVDGIAIEIAAADGPAQHGPHITVNEVCLCPAIAPNDRVEHAVYVRAMKISQPQASDQGDDVLSQVALDLLSAA
jgi:hypothetical protein